MGTIDPVILNKYRYGNDVNYIQAYESLMNKLTSSNSPVTRGCCYGAASGFIYEVMSGRPVDFGSDSIKLQSWLLKAAEHHSIYKKIAPAEGEFTLVKQMQYFTIKKPDAFYTVGPHSGVVSTNDIWQVIEIILKYPDRFPLGYISIKNFDRKYCHATAFASDKNYIYYYEPNYGLMRIARNDSMQINELFINSYRQEHHFIGSHIICAKKPAVVIEPY